MSEDKKRVGVVFDLEPETNQEELAAIMARLKSGVNYTWPILGDQDDQAIFESITPLVEWRPPQSEVSLWAIFESITPLVETTDDDVFAIGAGLFGLSRELEPKVANRFAKQVRYLRRPFPGLKSVRTLILPTGLFKEEIPPEKG